MLHFAFWRNLHDDDAFCQFLGLEPVELGVLERQTDRRPLRYVLGCA